MWEDLVATESFLAVFLAGEQSQSEDFYQACLDPHKWNLAGGGMWPLPAALMSYVYVPYPCKTNDEATTRK